MNQKFDFPDSLHKRIAYFAIGRSTLRNQGVSGMVAAARKYLSKLDLPDFSVDNSTMFDETLELHTQQLMRKFPKGGKINWGAARKSLNIFLRDVVYNQYLSRHHRLGQIELWLELPLDSYTVDGLKRDADFLDLPKWKGIKNLTQIDSDQFQDAALQVADKLDTFRVHLDVFYWRKSDLFRMAKSES